MGKKVIVCGLSEGEIDKAIRELEKCKQEIITKTELLRNKVAELIAKKAQMGFNGAILDDLVKGGVRYANVDVSVDSKGSITLVVANGEDAIWVEFGAGVYHNSGAGSSPHPRGSELGFTIGSFGKGFGKKEVWGFYEDGELKLTHGTPAIMPMYEAMKTTCQEIAMIAKEVFR